MTTTGLTNRPSDGNLTIQPFLCAPDAVQQAQSNVAEPALSQPVIDPNPDSWRVEVAARLERYRTRRKPRTPRYPSLLLPFDSPENWSRTSPPAGFAGVGSVAFAATPARPDQDFTLETESETEFETKSGTKSETNKNQTPIAEPAFADARPIPDQSAKVIEFPRSAAIPVTHPSDLADPVFDFDRPRIVEAPEILPPPPALGGMLIEPTPQPPADRRADFPSAFPTVSIPRRALAALVDGAVLTIALTAIVAVFLRLNPSLNPVRAPLPLLAAALGAVAVLLGMVYQFFFVVYTGSTPGLRAARLRLAAFDGSPLNRRARRWRVLASFLSALSAGLGYLWCFLDQGGLCWHDRITRTHVQSAAPRD